MAEQANPIWHISEPEAKNLARAVGMFQREFDVPVSDRAVAIGALGSALWFVYGTRLSALWMDAQAQRAKAARAASQKPAEAPTVPLRPQSPQPPPVQPAPAPTRADVHQPSEGYVNGAASFTPTGVGPGQASLVDPNIILAAINNPIPPKPPEQ